jgi:hypothetical protein
MTEQGTAPQVSTVPSSLPSTCVVQLRYATLPYFLRLIAVHYWFAVYDPAARQWHRWEVWQTKDAGGKSIGHVHCDLRHPDCGVGGGTYRLAAEWSGSAAQAICSVLQNAQDYPYWDRYRAWPGPNSNTFVAWVLRQAGLHHWFDPRAIGKDYWGLLGMRLSSGPTSAQKDGATMHGRIRCLIHAITGLVLIASAAQATTHEFYKGKTIRVIVSATAGGGFDTYSRAIARHMGKHIPGHPSLMVENMTGAGGFIAANYVYKVAKSDGLTIGNFAGGLIWQQLLGSPGVEFDARKFEYVGVPVQDHVACAFTKASGITRMETWMAAKTPVKLGATGPGTNTYDTPKVLTAALGLPIQVVAGYRGTTEIRLAADGGELAGADSPGEDHADSRESADAIDPMADLCGSLCREECPPGSRHRPGVWCTGVDDGAVGLAKASPAAGACAGSPGGKPALPGDRQLWAELAGQEGGG